MNLSNWKSAKTRRILLKAALATGAGALLAALDAARLGEAGANLPAFLSGWLAYSLLLGAAGVSLAWLLRVKAGNSPTACRAAWTAFLLRLAVGLALFWLLPNFGYADNDASRAGFIFKDAYTRDYQSWVLAHSDQPLLSAFSGKIPGDQYGGLLALNAGVYRYLSPTAHRPMLMVLLAAWAVGLGTVLLWAACQRAFPASSRAGVIVPAVAAWIMAVYPEGVLLGASQMREPFVMSAIAAAFYGLMVVSQEQSGGWTWLGVGLACLFLLQPPVALAATVVLLGLWLADSLGRKSVSHNVALLLATVLVVSLVALTLISAKMPSLQSSSRIGVVFTWLANNFGFQTHLTERASGMLQSMMRSLGPQWVLPLVLVYGFAQPVLPATLVEPSLPLWMTVNSLRAAGWYLLAPLLIYGLFTAFHPAPQPRRLQRIWLNLAVFAWIFISAANAGADMWDNPRYRTIFLPWLALLAGWALWWALERQDPWLWRWLAVEAVFVLFFLWWYISRYYPGWLHLSIWLTSGLTLGLAGLILVGGWVWDRLARRRGRKRSA